ncbi:MAG TPA: M13 family metallopeptidase [Kofleriaceae bacterium]|nr:M13 family metallopeptidase [Kofleriaceae bacterium]
MNANARMLCLSILAACAPSHPAGSGPVEPAAATPPPAAAAVPAPAARPGAQPAAPAKPAEPDPASEIPTGVDLAGIDRSVDAGDDFFAYANGGWLKTHAIPPDRSSYGTGALVGELTARRTAALIAEAARDAPPGSDARKIGDYYASFLDEAAIEARGAAPLQPALERIARITTRKALATALGESLRADVDVFNNTNFDTPNVFGLWVAQDLDEPSRYSAFLLQGGLGLPDRDYYLDASPRMAEIRDQYRAHVAAMLRLAGIAGPDAAATLIVDLEHKIAQAHAPRVETQDVKHGNNHWTRAQLAARAPGLDWQAFLAAAGLDRQAGFVVWQPRGVTGIAALVASQPLDTWNAYLTYHAISRFPDVLPRAFDDENFAFYGKQLSGTPEQRERWKRAVDATSDALGEAVGKLYVARYFPPAEKARAEAMVANELAAFARRIDNLSWMTPATKAKAKAKLAALKVGVGYPDKWRDYSGLEIVRGDAYGNAERAQRFEYRRNLAKLGRPVDRSEWVMNPQLVNAVNLPAMNALNFPAAILQPPYFDPSRPLAMDYGAAGSVIGHEISHSFDDQGAQFDAAGRLANWWTPEDFAHFKASAAQLIKQYDAYKPFPDLAVNGTLTVSENIADVAGLAAAYDAYRLAFGGKEAPTVQGLTGDQQFFLSFAQGWRRKAREPALRRQILTNGHAPSEYRADTVRNLDPWYAAFAVKPSDALYLPPADRVRVW